MGIVATGEGAVMLAPAWTRARRSRLAGLVLRKLLIALATLLAVCTAFAVGVGVYDAVLARLPLLLASWPRLLAGAVVVAVLGAWWLWWRLPKRQVARLRHAIRDPKGRADVEDNFRKTAGQLLGGAAVLIGAGVAYLQFTQQQNASQKQFDRQQQSAQDLLISNQVSKGFELLGNKDDKVEERLGGIYALEGVMNTSEKYHQSVLEALCALVRDYTKNKAGDAPPATDVQAVLTVIGRRKVGAAGEVNLVVRTSRKRCCAMPT